MTGHLYFVTNKISSNKQQVVRMVEHAGYIFKPKF